MSAPSRRLALRLVPFAIVAFAVGLALAGAEPNRPNVILIAIDTLRADHVSAYGYERETTPALDAFARENLKFDFAIASAPWTAPSIASMFTGLYPTAHGVVAHVPEGLDEKLNVEAAVLAADLETLAEILHERGYETAGITANAWIADYLGFAQGFASFETLDYANAEDVNRAAFEEIDRLAASGAPFFLYLHYMDPHAPYDPPKADRFEGNVASRSYAEHTQRQMNRYDGEIRFLDRQIGALFAFLRERGLYDDAVIVVVADHGEQFREHEKQGHGYSLRNVEIHVPLLVKAGGLRGEVERTVSVADVFPTILEIAGARFHSSHGVSLLDRSPRRTAVLSEQVGFSLKRGNQKAIVDARGRKLILDYDETDWSTVAPETELGTVGMYRSRTDPFEDEPILDLRLEKRLRKRFYSIYRQVAERRKGREVPKVTLEEATVERLRMLGYVGD